jgi:hypothetical protein
LPLRGVGKTLGTATDLFDLPDFCEELGQIALVTGAIRAFKRLGRFLIEVPASGISCARLPVLLTRT